MRLKRQLSTPPARPTLATSLDRALCWVTTWSTCTKDPFFKSFLKSYFKSLALGLARQGVIAVTIHKWGGVGGSTGQATCVTSSTTLRLIPVAIADLKASLQ